MANEWSERAYKHCPDGDRPTNEPGGMECEECQCIFIGAEWHSRCRVCEAKHNEAHDRAAYRYFTGKP